MFATLMRNTLLVPSVSVVRRHVFAAIGGFDEGRPYLGDDLDFFARCAMENRFMACPDITVRYRWHTAQCSANMHGTLINAARYRARIVEDMREHPAMREKVPTIADRAQMSWEEELETAWRKRELAGLRQMVKYGLQTPIFREVTRLMGGDADSSVGAETQGTAPRTLKLVARAKGDHWDKRVFSPANVSSAVLIVFSMSR